MKQVVATKTLFHIFTKLKCTLYQGLLVMLAASDVLHLQSLKFQFYSRS